jgi:uncharacterized membrane protein
MLRYPENTKRYCCSINFRAEEIPEINQLLAECQEKSGIEFQDTKQLFLHMLRGYTGQITFQGEFPLSPEPQPLPENTVILGEDDAVILMSNEFKTAVADFAEFSAMPADIPLTTLLISSLKSAIEVPEPAAPTEIALGPNEVLFQLNEKEAELVDYIIEARHVKFPQEAKHTRTTMCHDLSFNQNTLLNMGGAFYTGLG